MATPIATKPPTTIQSFVWAESPESPPEEVGGAVVADEPGVSCCAGVDDVDGASLVVVGASGVVVVGFFGLFVDGFLVVVGVDRFLAVVVVVAGLVVVVDAWVVVVVVDSLGGGSCADPAGLPDGNDNNTPSTATTAVTMASATAERRAVRCWARSGALTVLASS